MKITETILNTPIETEKSVRGEEIRVLTTGKAGRVLPIAYIPMLREDKASGKVRLNLEMAETVYPLMNAVNVTAYAHFVPFSAFERFNGMDEYNRSYQGIPEAHNGTVIPFFQFGSYSINDPLWTTMGIHHPHLTNINLAPIEAYNTLVNFRRKTRSKHLPLRSVLRRSDFAQAFWKHTNMGHIVPDYDDAAIDGEVELQWATPKLRISGLGNNGAGGTAPVARTVKEYGAVDATYTHSLLASDPRITIRTGSGGAPDVFAELQSAGIKLSLANLELAKQTAAFAKLREKYAGVSDDHLIDLLMEGIRIPEEAFRQPILLDRASTVFGYSERFATDAANLEKSVTTGATVVDLNIRMPQTNPGGIILITVEIVPEQLFERMDDQFLSNWDTSKLPNFMRDYLDPEKVEIVKNKHVDVLHATPDGVFGYAPLNHAWKRSFSRIGGRYFRPQTAGFVEDRQRFWSVEKLNPTLTSDFYLVPADLPHTVFKDTVKDPFEILALGNVEIIGNTVFGKTLQEDRDAYDKVSDQIDKTRVLGAQTPSS